MTPDNPVRQQPLVEQTFGEKLETWYDRNGKWISALVTLALVAFIGYKGYHWVNERNVAKANAAFATAQNHYQAGVQNPDAAKKTDELQGAITAAEKVVTDYSDKFVGRQAQLIIGNAQYAIAVSNSGTEQVTQLEKALESYKKYLTLAKTSEEQAVGNIAVGNVLENLGFIRDDKATLQQAVDAYTKAAEAAKGTNLAGEANLAAALAKSGIDDPTAQTEARQLYSQVAENRPVQMISEEAAKAIKPLELESGTTLDAEKVADLKNLTAWSHQQLAKDALARLK